MTAARSKGAGASKSNNSALENLSTHDQSLFHALRERRLSIAKDLGVPAYVVFGDRTLIELAQRKPATQGQLSRIYGVGDAKLARYGDAFLDVIRRHAT
jgi:ATP-dependent DNA helicase RecQ